MISIRVIDSQPPFPSRTMMQVYCDRCSVHQEYTIGDYDHQMQLSMEAGWFWAASGKHYCPRCRTTVAPLERLSE